MAWLGKVSLGGFPDLAGAVTKLSESVKNIEKNFDSALGFEEKTEAAEGGSPSGQWPSAEKTIFNPVMAFIGHKSGDSAESEQKTSSSQNSSPVKRHNDSHPDTISEESVNFGAKQHKEDETVNVALKQDNISGILEEPAEGHNSSYHIKSEQGNEVANLPIEEKEPINRFQETSGSLQHEGQDSIDVAPVEIPKDVEDSHVDNDAGEPLSTSEELHNEQPQMLHTAGLGSSQEKPEVEQFADVSPSQVEVLDNQEGEADEDIQQRKDEGDVSSATSASRITNDVPLEVETNVSADATGSGMEITMVSEHRSIEHEILAAPSALSSDSNETLKDSQIVVTDESGSSNSSLEMEKLTAEMKMMEAALQGAARQAQAKADEIAKLLIENEQLKSTLEDMRRRSSDAELESLREEYHHKVSNLEKKVYTLTKERDALRREQSRKSDAAVLLKEKDEIISQVMAEGEELSKKQATQEATIRKLRAQIREFEEEKQRLNSKIQVEESKVESMKRDKAATEKLLQETVEKSQAELASQKEFYINALNVAKEAQALAEARANTEAKIELEHRLREAGEREAALVQTLDELRQTLSRTEQQAVFREEMLRRDIDDLQKRYQASELRCEELITQVPESTRPLLRQIEAIQETSTRRAEVWSGVERALNARLQEAEAKAAAAEEKERSMNERLSQTLSRMAVLEAQVSCLRTEQTQLTRSLEKERQRASENRQEYLALQESAATLEGRAKQLEDELRELRSKHKQQLQEEAARREFLEEELERERTGRQELERGAQMVRPVDLDQETTSKYASNQYLANGRNISFNRLSSAGSLNSMEESYFLQASLDSSDNVISDRRMAMDFTASPYFGKSMTPGAIEHLEATLRQKDGELSSYISRLTSLESIRDSLAEELVKMTAQCEKLQGEVSQVSPLRAELEALRRRHTSALELMGERDEELEELRADIFDLKEMYREQVDLLVNKIQVLSASAR